MKNNYIRIVHDYMITVYLIYCNLFNRTNKIILWVFQKVQIIGEPKVCVCAQFVKMGVCGPF